VRPGTDSAGDPPTTGGTDEAPVRPVGGSFSPDPAEVAGSAVADPPVAPGATGSPATPDGGPSAGAAPDGGPSDGAAPVGGPAPSDPDAARPPNPPEEGGRGTRRSLLPVVLGALAVVAIVAVLIVLVVRTHDRSTPAAAPAAPTSTPPATQARSADGSSQTELIHAITLLKSQYSYLNTYGLVTIPWLAQRSPTISWVTALTPVQQSSQVSLAITPQSALVATRSKDGACWYVLDAEPGASAITSFQLPGPAMYFNMQTGGGSCDGSNPPMNGWGQTFPQP